MENRERRKHTRLALKAYGFSHACRLHTNSATLDVHLIDISPGGARLRFSGPASDHLGEVTNVRLDTRLVMKGTALDGLHSEVRWQYGSECGLMFLDELDVAATDLQGLLD